MNVLMLGWELPPNISGGLGTACAGLLRGMEYIEGLRVTFVMPAVSGEEGLPHVRLLGLQQAPSIHHAYARVDASAGQRAAVGSYRYGIFREVREYAENALALLGDAQAFDIIHAHDWLTFEAAVALREKSGKNLVVHVHSTEFDRSGGGVPDPGIYEIERRGMEKADRIIAVSEYTKNIIVAKYGQPPDKIEVVRNAIELRGSRGVVRHSINGKVVTFLGRITCQKGPEFFVDAAYKISERMEDVRFVMAGDGDLLPLVKSLVKSLGLGNRFSFPGFLDTDGVSALLAESDLLIMPSISEPFGLVALEAMDAGVPVLLSRHCGLADMLEYVVKIDPHETGHIAEAGVGLLADPDRARAMVDNARAEVGQFSWTASAKQLHRLYGGLLEKAPICVA